MRDALNNMQATYAGMDNISADTVFKVVDQPHPLTIQMIVQRCLEGNASFALKQLQGTRGPQAWHMFGCVDTYTRAVLWGQGYAAIDIIGTLFRSVCNSVTSGRADLQQSCQAYRHAR